MDWTYVILYNKLVKIILLLASPKMDLKQYKMYRAKKFPLPAPSSTIKSK